MAPIERRGFGTRWLDVPVIGQGTWQMERDDRAACIAALRRGIELGLTHVDTAEMYGSGRVEELVGEAIVGLRDRIFLVSKVLPSNASYEGTLRACERSLRRLRVERLDVLLLHWPGPHALEETFRAFEALVSSGKIGAYGVSNFDVDELESALAIAGRGKIACNQVLYHLQERAIEASVLPWCERHDVAVVGYSPFGGGRFPSATSRGGVVLAEIAAAHRASPRQVALAFLTRAPSLFTIPKAADEAHVEDNAAGGRLRLSSEDVQRIDLAFPIVARSGLPTL